MNTVELNLILYYADFLSMEKLNTPVTDTCKYFFIHNTPINACFIADVEPTYDENNEFFKQSKEEYTTLVDKFGSDGVKSFINNICNLSACGCVDANRMLSYIYQFSPRYQYYEALNKYNNWKKSLTFKHIVKNDDGDPQIAKCGKDYAHVEKALGRRIESSLVESSRINEEELEEFVKNNK